MNNSIVPLPENMNVRCESCGGKADFIQIATEDMSFSSSKWRHLSKTYAFRCGLHRDDSICSDKLIRETSVVYPESIHVRIGHLEIDNCDGRDILAVDGKEMTKITKIELTREWSPNEHPWRLTFTQLPEFG